jgi:two-component system sensor histidine kinase RegB
VALDCAILTFVLGATGGATNPFVNLYLVEIALAAALLGPRWSWGMAGLCTIAYAFLFNVSPPHDLEMHAFESHLQGMWIAFVLSAILVAAFSSRLARVVERQRAELRVAHEKREEANRLAGLTAFAAEAVHELSTPLTTLAVVAGEMERDASLGRRLNGSDFQLVQREVARCGEILSAMSGRAAGTPSTTDSTRLHEVVTACAARLTPPDRARVECAIPDKLAAAAPREAIERSFMNLLNNALEARRSERIVVRGEAHPDGVALLIDDDGEGLSPDAMAQAGRPFFSTKKASGGLGMGLFAARSLVAPFGGEIELKARAEGGTRARLFLPHAT